jgi:hypothetical protein
VSYDIRSKYTEKHVKSGRDLWCVKWVLCESLWTVHSLLFWPKYSSLFVARYYTARIEQPCSRTAETRWAIDAHWQRNAVLRAQSGHLEVSYSTITTRGKIAKRKKK